MFDTVVFLHADAGKKGAKKRFNDFISLFSGKQCEKTRKKCYCQ